MQNAVRGFWLHLRQHQDRAINRCYLDRLQSNVELWKSHFPAVKPYYAVKCNPHPVIVNYLNSVGYAFDCASTNEIKQVQDSYALAKPASLGQQSFGFFNWIEDRKIRIREPGKPAIIFANPIKNPLHLIEAKARGIKRMTADCPEEVEKIKQYYPEAEIILRIAVDDSQSICKFNSKFGLVPEKANLSRFFNAFKPGKGPQVIGTSFHVGSGCLSSFSYKDAIQKSRYVFDYAQNLGINLTVMDIGGGFVQQQPLLTDVAKTINTELKHWKSSTLNYPTEVIAEPGRFLANNVFDLYATVIGKKKEGDHIKYYINDGTYGSFNCIMFDHRDKFDFDVYRQSKTDSYPQKIASKSANGWNQPTFKTTLFGQTCDSIDVIMKEIDAPELEIGDHLCFHNMGAYTFAATTQFNGFPFADVYCTDVSK